MNVIVYHYKMKHYSTYIPVDENDPLNSDWLHINDTDVKICANVDEVLSTDTVKKQGRVYTYKQRKLENVVLSLMKQKKQKRYIRA